MGRRKTFRKKIKKQDELLSGTERAIQYVKEQPVRIAMIAGLVVVILLTAWGAWFYAGYRRGKILELGGEAYTLYQAAREDMSKIDEAAGQLESVYQKYPRSSTGQTSLYLAAGLYFSNGSYEQALENYQLLEEKHPDNELLYPLVVQNIMYCREQQGDYRGALEMSEKLMSLKTDIPRAQLHVDAGRIYEELGEGDKARSSYEEIADTYPSSPWAPMAREKLGRPIEEPAGI